VQEIWLKVQAQSGMSDGIGALNETNAMAVMLKRVP
jgi:hypothetical protein